MNYSKYILILLLLPVSVFAQELKGRVLEHQASGHGPLTGASVVWINSNKGSVTDAGGYFNISSEGMSEKKLVVSFVGFKPDTLVITNQSYIEITLQPIHTLKTAEVVFERSGTMISMNPIKTEMITSKELKKAACCNLGESFETNATVDVTYKDAITGSKEIQVLGLSGAYTQILTENSPMITGLGLTYGLNGIPGTQIDAINIVKGPGSVIFGPESISGMVNVDLKDPDKSEWLFVNGFVDENLRKEINVDKGIRVNDRLHGLVSFHADHFDGRIDRNNDSFLDMPLLTNVSLLNKWKYVNGKGLMSQNSVKYLYEERMGGQVGFDFSKDRSDPSAWGQKLRTDRMELYGRTGYVIPSASYNSIGLQYAFVNHEQHGFYGMRDYAGSQQLLSLRLIYNRELGRMNSINMGLSLKSDHVKEIFDTLNRSRTESMPGIFIENTFKPGARLVLITGLRADLLNEASYITPRANIKYSLTDRTDLRLSGGYGFKTVNILAENPAILVSSREIIIQEQLDPEIAYNIGANLTHEFTIAYRKGSLGVDVYRTVFENKIMPDFDRDPLRVYFYNTRNNAYSNNVQIEGMYKILKTVELKLAYKYLDVYSMQNGEKIADAYIARHRALANLYYESFNRKWKANLTTQWVGQKRLPVVHSYFPSDRFKKQSPVYTVVNAQVTRVYKKIEVYLGAENLFDFRQTEHILGSDDPYGPYFDASYIWGPMDGRKVYAGFRYKITKNKI
jgi:outer membrane receptor for ferrienterochelin and colicins